MDLLCVCRRAFCLTITLLLLSAMGACSSTFFSEPLEQSDAPQPKQLQQRIEQLAATQAQYGVLLEQYEQQREALTRLVALEAELKLLMRQLSEFKVQQRQAHKTAHLAPVAPSEHNDVAGMYAAQLTAMRQPGSLSTFWQRVKQRYPELLKTVTPYYEPVSSPTGTLYRLKAGTFAEKQAADQFCARLRANQLPCIVSTHDAGSQVLEP